MSEVILLLNPGAMGTSIGAALHGNGHRVLWVAAGRSAQTVERAEKTGLESVASLDKGLADADHVISVVPPDAALDIASQVAAHRFTGTYLDANAVAPASAREIGAALGDGCVDGGIVGPPAWRAGSTRLYLSGLRAAQAAAWFADSLVDARVIEGAIGAASALKMCYASYTKGTSALLLAIRALAQREHVSEALLDEWDLSQPGLHGQSDAAASRTAAKAWRFEGEMHEIAATFEAADLPPGFHLAAAEIYRRMRDLKDVPPEQVDIDTVLEHLLAN
jgi:3-hydroxyisobutyrate dehydrogenase-like beta-hydroxyacid dehydrogenase